MESREISQELVTLDFSLLFGMGTMEDGFQVDGSFSDTDLLKSLVCPSAIL